MLPFMFVCTRPPKSGNAVAGPGRTSLIEIHRPMRCSTVLRLSRFDLRCSMHGESATYSAAFSGYWKVSCQMKAQPSGLVRFLIEVPPEQSKQSASCVQQHAHSSISEVLCTHTRGTFLFLLFSYKVTVRRLSQKEGCCT